MVPASTEPGRRGRRPRAGVRATRRVDLRLTDAEYGAINRCATAYDLTLPDLFRLGALYVAARFDEGDPVIVMGGEPCLPEAPDPDDGFLLPPKRRGDLRL